MTGMLPAPSLRYQELEALDWRKWTKGGSSFLFVRAVLIELSCQWTARLA